MGGGGRLGSVAGWATMMARRPVRSRFAGRRFAGRRFAVRRFARRWFRRPAAHIAAGLVLAIGVLGGLAPPVLAHGANALLPPAPSDFLFDWAFDGDRKSTRLNSSHVKISYAVFC